jgi:hypothetical protein
VPPLAGWRWHRLTRCQRPASPTPRCQKRRCPIQVRHLTERKVERRCHFAEDIVPSLRQLFCCPIFLTDHPGTHSQLRLAPVSRHSTLQMGLGTTIRSLSAKVCGPPFLPDPPPSPSRQLPRPQLRIRLASRTPPRSGSPQTEPCSIRRLPPTTSLRRSFRPSGSWCASISQMKHALRTTSARRLTSSSDRWRASRPPGGARSPQDPGG